MLNLWGLPARMFVALSWGIHQNMRKFRNGVLWLFFLKGATVSDILGLKGDKRMVGGHEGWWQWRARAGGTQSQFLWDCLVLFASYGNKCAPVGKFQGPWLNGLREKTPKIEKGPHENTKTQNSLLARTQPTCQNVHLKEAVMCVKFQGP